MPRSRSAWGHLCPLPSVAAPQRGAWHRWAQEQGASRGTVNAGRGGFSVPLLGPHQELHPLYFQFSPELQAPTSSLLLLRRGWRSCLLGGLWWGLGDFLLLPILSTAGQDRERVRRCLGNACMHAFIHSFKAMYWCPPHAWSRPRWCWGHSSETTSSPVLMGL